MVFPLAKALEHKSSMVSSLAGELVLLAMVLLFQDQLDKS
jgi:hypothetical protein